MKICIVAGEASGDLLGALLIDALKASGVHARFYGIAGPKMQAAGATSLFPMEALSVRGYVEALSALPRILRIRKRLIRHCLNAKPEDKPDLYIGIDAPDFNLGVETRLKAAGIPTVHFVSPSVWAWRANRLKKMAQAANHTLLIFPMEQALYDAAHLPATYVGHPFAHHLPLRNEKAARERLKLDARQRQVVLMPGSRVSELKALADLFVLTAKQLHENQPTVQFLVPLVTRETLALFEAALSRHDAWGLPVRILYGHAHDALEAADCALIASGTASLEALLLGCPHLITYKVPKLTAWIMLRKAKLKRGQKPRVGLPNFLAGHDLVPEFLQEDAEPKRLSEALTTLLNDPAAAAAQRNAFAEIREQLTRDTPRLISKALQGFADGVQCKNSPHTDTPPP